jgi:hypothetical protein
MLLVLVNSNMSKGAESFLPHDVPTPASDVVGTFIGIIIYGGNDDD